MVSPVSRQGAPQPNCHAHDGTQLREARRRKERKYRELLASRRARLVVVALEVGGRWSDESATFLRQLAHCKARAYPAILRQSLTQAYLQRWSGFLAAAAFRAFAASLLELPIDEAAAEGFEAPIEDVLREARLVEPPVPSRLPAA